MNISTEHILQCNQSGPLADASGRIADLMNENRMSLDVSMSLSAPPCWMWSREGTASGGVYPYAGVIWFTMKSLQIIILLTERQIDRTRLLHLIHGWETLAI